MRNVTFHPVNRKLLTACWLVTCHLSLVTILGAPEPVRTDSKTGTVQKASGGADLDLPLTSKVGGTALTSKFEAKDADLDALAALTGTNTIYYRSAPDVWSAVTIGTGIGFNTGSLTLDQSISPTWTGLHSFNPGTLGIGQGSPFLITQTWDSTLTPFTGLLMNITPSRQAAGSRLIKLNYNGSDVFDINGAGSIFTTGLINAGTGLGYQIGGSAPSGHYLRGNGAYYVDSALLPDDFGLSSIGIVKRTGANILAIAAAGTDYENPLTFTDPLSRNTNAISIAHADSTHDGIVTSGDWNLFNGKLSPTSPAFTGYIVVSPASAGGNDSNCARSDFSKPCASLNQAHTLMSDGDVIYMDPNTNYPSSANLTLSKNNFTIIGYGANLVSTAASNGTKLTITGHDVKIYGLNVDGVGAPVRTIAVNIANVSNVGVITDTSGTGTFSSADINRRFTFWNQKNAFAGNYIASVTNATTANAGAVFGATITGATMEIWPVLPNVGMIEVQGARCTLEDMWVHDFSGHGVRLGAGSDGFRATRVRVENCHFGFVGTNGSANPVFDVVISNCSAKHNRYDGFRLSDEGYTGTGASFRGPKIINNTARDSANWGAELYGAESSADAQVDGNYFENSGLGGISMAATNHSSASNNKIRGFFGTGIEFANCIANSYNKSVGNIIDRSNEDGTTQPVWNSGSTGYSISQDSGTANNIKLDVNDNTIVVPDGNAIKVRSVKGVYCNNNHTYTGSTAYVFQAATGDISVTNAYGEINSTSAYGIWADSSGQASTTGFRYFSDTLINVAGTDTYPLIYFYASDAPRTFSDVTIKGAFTNVTHCGSGFVAGTSGNIINSTSFDNYPNSATDATNAYGFADAKRQYNITATHSITLGDHTGSSTATPRVLDLGGSFSNTANANFKLQIYNNGSSVYGIGVSSGQMDFGIPSTASFDFYVGTTLQAVVDSSGFTDNGALTLAGTLTPTALSADQNNYNPTGLSTAFSIRIDGGAADRNITGLAGGVDGAIKELVNIGTTNKLTLKDQSASSTATNRILVGSDVEIPPNKSFVLRYDGTSTRWRPFDRALANTGVTPGTYGSASQVGTFTVDAQGRITSASNTPNARSGVCDGRLTTESGVPISTSDRTAQSTIYFTPYNGNAIAIYDGATWKGYTFSEISLALSGLTSGKNYDVFIYDNSGTLTLELSAAWTNDSTRADAISLQDGVYVKTSATSRRYLGTIRTTGTTTTEDSGGGVTTQVGGKRFVWNYYNRIRRNMKVIDTTSSWSYTTGTIRQANNAAGNQVEYVYGQALPISVRITQTIEFRTLTALAEIGIGLDSTTAFSGYAAGTYVNNNNDTYVTVGPTYAGIPALGYHYIAWLEKGGTTSTGACSFWGSGQGMQSGMTAEIDD